jgi:hypothetical protein
VSNVAVELARQALKQYPQCFWMRAPEAVIRARGDVELVVRRLRENGGQAGWKAALEIEKCL